MAEAAFLNRAVWMFGTRVDNAIREAMEGKSGGSAIAARNQALTNWLGTQDRPGTFRDPTSVGTR